MGRIVGIDFGEKRTGLAWTDVEGKIAFPLEGVDTSELMSRLERLCIQEPIAGFVVGLPKRLDGRDTHATEGARRIARRIAERFPEKFIVLTDERLSSSVAQKALCDSGARRAKRRDKRLLDSMAAAVILQDYLSQPK
ncbi:MAG: Holliday junction resolvase RuvX [Bacteroidia bacterium]|nr:Holliday junction resolvase RuvX [Bacteroidia bacterium]